ncbi:osmoprotectant transport system permease protein [Paenibacillus sp. yr247]|uniref:ABC transporter permease n=1 Tax=Paenibacillus sp. yr247 TaxID=1761880 RepID=UPI000883460E|nr:ABC transporter permease [Paenibacillus sp. yr247]SDO33343.1 osmoprotectant transport system permease protein [Paenibacillus sp. yr247]
MIHIFQYMEYNFDRLIQLTIEHLFMALAAVLIGILTGIPLGVLIARKRWLTGTVLWIANAFQTIPVLALVGFLMIFLGLGKGTAITALYFYTLLPIIQSTYTGLNAIEPSIIEAAKGMGMSQNQIFWKIEIPMSLSILFVGIRIAAVVSIGTTTIMSLVGAGGLGYEIFTGINRMNNQMVIIGALLAALLAYVVQKLIQWFEVRFTSKGLKIIK